jgi:hypothetical protein
MAYTTPAQVYDILAQALTSATNRVVNGQPVPLWTFGKAKDSNSISDDTVYQYITWASDQIDAALSELYVVPFMEKIDLELSLLVDIDTYNDAIELDKAMSLNVGDSLIFADTLNEERHTVSALVNNTTIELQEPLLGIYHAETTRVVRVRFPAPINVMATRLAAANIYDKYFSAQANPDKSDYGKTLRSWALSDMNAIINGITILHGQTRIGQRFFNPTLRDRYSLPPLDKDFNIKIEGGDK